MTSLEPLCSRKCTVISCDNFLTHPIGNVKFFPFPENRELAGAWKEKCGVASTHPLQHARICECHFDRGDFLDENTLSVGAVPKANLAWMVGIPEVKITKREPLDFEAVKTAVDKHEFLQEKLESLIREEAKLKEQKASLCRRISKMDEDLLRVKKTIGKFPRKKGRNEANLIGKVFSPAQIHMLCGKKKVVWSYDDMAMAFTLRHTGNRECYLYLKNTLNFPLPSLSSVQRWVASNQL